MARRAKPFNVGEREGWACIDFRFAGKRIREALGVPYHAKRSSPEEARRAHEAAAEFYARFLSGRRVTPTERVQTAARLEELIAAWLDAIETPTNRRSVQTRTTYGRHWRAFAARPEGKGDVRTSLERLVADSGPADYAMHRLGMVIRKTVRKEISNLFTFLRWCKLRGHLASLPPRPELPKGEPGVRSGRQRARPVRVTPEEALAVIDALPEWSRELPADRAKAEASTRKLGRRYRVRDVLAFMWETALRPATIARLEVPRNWAQGSSDLVLDDADDKVRYGRTVPLSPRARVILGRVAPEAGLVFGRHDYRVFVKTAALKALPVAKAVAFASYDFRHGRANAWLALSGNMLGVAHLMGHKQLTTTNAYLAPNEHHAAAVIATLPDDGEPVEEENADAIRSHEEETTDENTAFFVGASGFEPPTPRPPARRKMQNAGETSSADADPPRQNAAENEGREIHADAIRSHAVLTDAARALAVENAIWDAFDSLEFSGLSDEGEG